ncbi:hypothetical protein D3C71_1362080 [compost metagenome]
MVGQPGCWRVLIVVTARGGGRRLCLCLGVVQVLRHGAYQQLQWHGRRWVHAAACCSKNAQRFIFLERVPWRMPQPMPRRILGTLRALRSRSLQACAPASRLRTAAFSDRRVFCWRSSANTHSPISSKKEHLPHARFRILDLGSGDLISRHSLVEPDPGRDGCGGHLCGHSDGSACAHPPCQ